MQSDYGKEIPQKFLQILDSIKVKNESESNLSFHVIEPILIDFLGYKKEWITKELRPIGSKKEQVLDLLIKSNTGKSVVVEIKKVSESLRVLKNINQICDYLYRLNLTWGILTNGYEWMLINNQIDIPSEGNIFQKVVFHIDLRKWKSMGKSNPQNLIYFSYPYLYEYEYSKYHEVISQCKVYVYEKNRAQSTWEQYENNVSQLVRYLIAKHPEYYYPLENIQPYQFLDFLKWCATTQSESTRGKNTIKHGLSEESIKNYYRFIRSFYSALSEKGYFNNNPLNNISLEEIKTKMGDLILEKAKSLRLDNLNQIVEQTLERLGTSREPLRNRLILLLALYGLDRNEISKLEVSDYDGKHIYIDDTKKPRRIPLTQKMTAYIHNLLELKKEKKINSKWLIYKGTGEKLTPSYISEIINDALKSVSDVTLEELQQYTIKKILLDTKDIISLQYLTGLDINRLGSLLEWTDIEKFANCDKLMKKHPFHDLIS